MDAALHDSARTCGVFVTFCATFPTPCGTRFGASRGLGISLRALRATGPDQ